MYSESGFCNPSVAIADVYLRPPVAKTGEVDVAKALKLDENENEDKSGDISTIFGGFAYMIGATLMTMRYMIRMRAQSLAMIHPIPSGRSPYSVSKKRRKKACR